jgi:hypothetical protein
MTEPAYNRTAAVLIIRDVLIVAAAVLFGVWLLLDDSPPDWIIRLAIAGALVSGFALGLAALVRVWLGRSTPSS